METFSSCFIKCFGLMTVSHLYYTDPTSVQNYIYLSYLMSMIYWFLVFEEQQTCPLDPLEVIGQGLDEEEDADGNSDSSTEISEKEEVEEEIKQDAEGKEQQVEEEIEEGELKEEVNQRDPDWLSKVD